MEPNDFNRLSETERFALGYMKAKLETVEAKLDYHIALKQRGEEEYGLRKAVVDERLDKLEDDIRKDLSEIRDQLSIYKSFIKFAKTLGMIIVALLTFKLGDVGDLIKSLIK